MAFLVALLSATLGAVLAAALMVAYVAWAYVRKREEARSTAIQSPSVVPSSDAQTHRSPTRAHPAPDIGVLRINLPDGMTFGVPIDPTAEYELMWWHIDIGVTDDEGGAQPHRVFLVMEEGPGNARERQLMWATPEGPQDEIVLRTGETGMVPIAARSIIGAFLCAAPGRLPPFEMHAGVTRLTDRETMTGSGPGIELAPGELTFRLIVRYDGRETRSPRYSIRIPPERGTVSEFMLMRFPD